MKLVQRCIHRPLLGGGAPLNGSRRRVCWEAGSCQSCHKAWESRQAHVDHQGGVFVCCSRHSFIQIVLSTLSGVPSDEGNAGCHSPVCEWDAQFCGNA